MTQSLPDQPDLDIPCLSYEDLGDRWSVSPWTIRRWCRLGKLARPVYLTPVTVRFTERQARALEGR